MTGRSLLTLGRLLACALAWLMFAPPAFAQWTPSGPAGQSTTPLSDRGKALALASGARVLVVGQDNRSLAVVDPDIGTVLGTVPLPHEPKAVAITANGARAYVVYGNNKVTAVDVAARAVIATWTVSGELVHVALMPGETELALANAAPRRLLEVSATTGALIRQLSLSHEPREVIRASGDSRLVVGAKNGWLITVDPGSFTVLSQLKLADEIRSLSWWGAGARVVAAHNRTDAASLVDISVPQVTATVATDGDPDRVAVSETAAGVAYVATHDDASVNRIDLTGPTLMGRYAIAARINALVFDPARNVLYGALRNDDKLIRLDPATAVPISVLQLQKRLRDVTINPATHEAVAVADKSDEMFIIRLSDRSVRQVGLPARPDLVALDTQLNTAVVAFRGSGPKLRFADLAAGALFAETISYDKDVTGLAVASNLALAVAITEGERPVLVIDTSARTRLADGPADRYRAVAVHAGRSIAYLANQDRQLKVMDLATRAIIATVELGFRVNAITIDEALDKAVLITDSGNKAHVLNLSTNQLESDYTLPRHPGAISLNTDTHIAVIASRESDSLSLIDLTTNTLTAGFTIIDKAHAVAVSHRHNQAVVLSGVQNELIFVQLPNPLPVLDSMTPVQAPVGSPALVLTLNGKGFFDGSKVFFGSDLLTTRLLGATRLEAEVPASLLTTSRTVPVTVQNPSPSGGTSNALNFVVGGGPLLSAIFPGSAPADGQAKTLTLQGQNFVSGASVLFGATTLPATVQGSTGLTVIIPAGPLTSSPGTVQVSVVNPGGQASNSLPFTFTPALVISGFTPASGPVGTAVAISGVGFNPVTSNNSVRFNGEAAVIASGNATTLNAIVPLRATSGFITVTNQLGTATSPTPFTVEEREAFEITLAPELIQVPTGGNGATLVRLFSTGLNPYPYAAALAVTGLPAGVTAAFDRPTVALNLDSVLTFTVQPTVGAGSYPITVTATGQTGVRVTTRSKLVTLAVLAAGTTTVTGRVLHADDGAPFVGARVRLGAAAVFTDQTGTYRFVNPPVTGDQVLLIDGNTNNTATVEFPSGIAMPVMIVAGQDNKVLTSYIQRIDATKFTNIVPGAAATVTNPDIPNFSLNIPQGATLFGWDNQPITKVSVRTVSVDRLPIRPIPDGVETRSVYLYYFFREGGANPTQPIPVSMPNDIDALPGEQVEMWYYDESATPDPNSNQWRVMGMGTVSADGKMIVSNPGVGIPRFCCGASFIRRLVGIVTGWLGGSGCGSTTTNPVDLSSGNALAFYPRPFGISKIMPVNPNCQYRSTDPRIGLFGRGMSFTYDWFAEPAGSEAVRVVNPQGVSFILSREADGVFRARSGRTLAIEMEVTPTATGRTLRLADGTQYEFNTAGQLTAVVDLSGNRTTFQLTTQGGVLGFPTSMTDAAGKLYQFQTSGTPPVITRITDPAGRFVQFDYDPSRRLIRYTDQGGGVTQFEYDANNRISRLTDPRGAVKTFEYDAAGRTTRETLPENAEERYAYTTVGSTVTETRHTDANGNVTTYRFNGLGFEASIVDALGRVRRFDRDPATNLVRRVTDPAGRVRQFTYNQRGDVIRVLDAQNNQTLIDYDLRFRRPTRIENASGNATSLEYNSQGKITKIISAENEITTFTYTPKGQLETVTDPLNRTTRFAYDPNGNLQEATNPANETVVRSYDLANRLIEVTDALSRTTRLTYDSLDRVTEVRDAALGLTKFAYDANDNLTSATDQNNNPVERNLYDLRNRLTQSTDAKNLSTTYVYDGVGNLTRMTDRRGRVIDYRYDALNRITQVSDTDGRVTTYDYNLAGNLARITDSQSGDILMSYDSLNRLTEVVTPQGALQYAYDAIGRRTSRTITGGDVTTYTYDKVNRLKTVTLRGRTASYVYDPAGRLTEKMLPNGIKTTYQYDAADRVTGITYTKPDNTPVEGVSYTYDQSGQRIAKSLGGSAVQETPFTATYDEANRLTAITMNGEAFTLTYDANGNLETKSGPTSGTTAYTWNARNQLMVISGPSGSASFKYNALGRRIEKTVNGATTGFLYDGAQAIAELKGGALDAVYHTGVEIDEVLARYGASGNRTLLSDALMSVIAQGSDDQSIANSYSYSPYGQGITLGSDSGNSLQYTGRENDGTGLYYYRARYYDPALKRFISEDPIGLTGGTNLYAYVGGSPVLRTDPDGTDWKKKVGEILLVIATAIVDPTKEGTPTGRTVEEENTRTEQTQQKTNQKPTPTGGSGKGPKPKTPVPTGGGIKVPGGIVTIVPTIVQMMCDENPWDPACRVINPVDPCDPCKGIPPEFCQMA